MSQDVTLVNTYYPLDYFAANPLAQSVTSVTDFWASTEELAPAVETVTYNFGVARPLNFIDFEICTKPIDIFIEYQDSLGNWFPINYNSDYALQSEVQFLPSKVTPWIHSEHHFSLVQTQFARITFTRRTDPFPLPDSDPFPWSIEVRNARFLNVIQSVDDFIPDQGTDILGNSYRTDLTIFPATNTTDLDDSTLWQSQPNPTPFAVESLYFDVRTFSIPGTMTYLDTTVEGELDTRSMADIENYKQDAIVIDEVFIDPITFGPSMHIYYSLDDTPEWDNKLWIPINKTYVLKKGYHALPSPTLTKYVKLEFSNLVPAPYNVQEFPTLPPIEYNKFPTWVQNYFNDNKDTPKSKFINPVDRVTIDPLELGFRKSQDTLNSGLETRNSPAVRDTEQEIRDFLTGTITHSSQVDVEDKIQFNSPYQYQVDLIGQLDNTRALSRIAKDGETGWNAELPPLVESTPVIQSVPDLSTAHAEKTAHIMYFPFKCRHGYQTIRASRPSKIAYFVSIREVSFYRRDYTAQFDEPFYIETFDDTAHFGAINDFLQDDWRFVITPSGP